MSETTARAIPRRSLFIGAGAGTAIAVLGASGAQAAVQTAGRAAGSAGPVVAATDPLPNATAGQAETSPITSTLASAPISGYTYAYRSMWDFGSEGGVPWRWSSSGGAWAPDDTIWTSVEIPAGARIRDIEWYIYNASAANTALGRLWRAGTSTLFTTIADTAISVGTGIRAFRTVVPAATYGPYPPGTVLTLGIFTPGDGTTQVNGVRVGFDQGTGRTGVLATPVRVYDSRSTGGIIAAGASRTITLPAAVAPPGTAGIVANVMALGSSAAGQLIVHAANTAQPAITSLRYSAGQLIENTVTVGISSGRQIKVYASTASHVIVDVVATIA